jgi:hypothetical protein
MKIAVFPQVNSPKAGTSRRHCPNTGKWTLQVEMEQFASVCAAPAFRPFLFNVSASMLGMSLA